MTPSQCEILRDIIRERARQDRLKANGKFAYTCADVAVDFGDNEKMLVLVEEMGEVGHELNEGIGAGRSVDREKLRAELIQVAAVAMAWCEAIDAEIYCDNTRDISDIADEAERLRE